MSDPFSAAVATLGTAVEKVAEGGAVTAVKEAAQGALKEIAQKPISEMAKEVAKKVEPAVKKTVEETGKMLVSDVISEQFGDDPSVGDLQQSGTVVGMVDEAYGTYSKLGEKTDKPKDAKETKQDNQNNNLQTKGQSLLQALGNIMPVLTELGKIDLSGEDILTADSSLGKKTDTVAKSDIPTSDKVGVEYLAKKEMPMETNNTQGKPEQADLKVKSEIGGSKTPETKNQNSETKNDGTESDTRELTEAEKNKLGSQLSGGVIDNLQKKHDGTYLLKTINADKVDTVYEGVKYVAKKIIHNGIKIEGVFPQFKSVFECAISKELWNKGDIAVFKECTKKLWEYLEANPELKKKFTDAQLKQIANGEERIKGYTWHHCEEPGKMQLVETKIHAKCRHTGGNMIWCRGIR